MVTVIVYLKMQIYAIRKKRRLKYDIYLTLFFTMVSVSRPLLNLGYNCAI